MAIRKYKSIIIVTETILNLSDLIAKLIGTFVLLYPVANETIIDVYENNSQKLL